MLRRFGIEADRFGSSNGVGRPSPVLVAERSSFFARIRPDCRLELKPAIRPWIISLRLITVQIPCEGLEAEVGVTDSFPGSGKRYR